MIRFIIFFGFTYFFIQLHASGNISKYINMKYSYLSYSMIYVMGFLTIFQLIKWVREGNKEEGDAYEHHHHDHDHSKDENTWYKKIIVYGLLLIPLITGIFFPVATLDATIVKAKGFHFSILDDSDQYSNHEILRPNSSLYYDQGVYQTMENADLKKYDKDPSLVLNDENYFRALETMYNYPGDFMGKTVTINGFVYRTSDLKSNELYILRFGIIHCIADAGVFGMQVDFPKSAKNIKVNQWIEVTGVLTTGYNRALKETIPYLSVTKWEKISQPKDPYVYRTYN